MAIIPTKEQNQELDIIDPRQAKQKQLVYVLGFILFLLAGIFYFGFYGTTAIAPPTVSPAIDPLAQQKMDGLVNGLKDAKLDQSFLDDKTFQQLIIYGQLPLTVEQKGRTNPFAPF